MAFVNELVSEADINKHSLDDLMRGFHPWAWRDGRPSSFAYSWTIDRELGVFFMQVKFVEEIGPSGRPQPTRKTICVLDFGGRRVQLEIERDLSSSSVYADIPFRIIWNLEDLDMSSVPDLNRSDVISVLKQALTVHGESGKNFQVPNTVVTFNF